MRILCENLGPEPLLISQIRDVGQIYRFDEFRITLGEGEDEVIFDVPSAEWLEHYTDALKAKEPVELHTRLTGSGYDFQVRRTDGTVGLNVYEVRSRKRRQVHLDHEHAARLQRTVLKSLLLPFREQGGEIESLEGLDRFCLTTRELRDYLGRRASGD